LVSNDTFTLVIQTILTLLVGPNIIKTHSYTTLAYTIVYTNDT